jgi:hypothetical protein
MKLNDTGRTNVLPVTICRLAKFHWNPRRSHQLPCSFHGTIRDNISGHSKCLSVTSIRREAEKLKLLSHRSHAVSASSGTQLQEFKLPPRDWHTVHSPQKLTNNWTQHGPYCKAKQCS